MIIVDTNVVSDMMRGGSAPVREWLSTIAGPDLYTTAITRSEIRFGVDCLPAGRRREALQAAADAFFSEVSDRTLSFGAAEADRYGELAAARRTIGRPISVPDGQIASIASVHRAAIATRNVRDFEECGVKVINPFCGS